MAPHNGTGTMPELIEELSNHVIPVLSVGNEGGSAVHIYKAFDEENSSMKALLARATTTFDEEGNILRLLGSVVRGFSRYELGENDVLNVQIGIANRGDAETLWLSEPCTISLTQNGAVEIFSDEDEILGNYMQDGFVAIYGSVVDGKIDLTAAATGFLPRRYPFFILLSSTSPIEMDLILLAPRV